MTPTQRAAIELAIADFEHISAAGGRVEFVERRISALRAALAETEPRNHVGDSQFESWFSGYNPSGKGDKQRARDAWDAEQARIKAEAEAKERARVLAITERIAAIKSYVVMANNCRTSERVFDLRTKLSCVDLEVFEEFEEEASNAYREASEHLETVFADRQAQEAEAARLKAERAELARQQAEAAEAKARAAAEALAAERAELERMRAYMESIKEHVEQPLADVAAQVEAKRQAAKQTDPETAPVVTEAAPVVAEPAPVVSLPAAPVASAIVLAVAEFWHTDNKTAARWITERAAEIESLR